MTVDPARPTPAPPPGSNVPQPEAGAAEEDGDVLAPPPDRPWGAIVAIVAVIAVAFVSWFAIQHYKGDDAAKSVIAVVGPILAALTGIVSAYFGLRSQSLSGRDLKQVMGVFEAPRPSRKDRKQTKRAEPRQRPNPEDYVKDTS